MAWLYLMMRHLKTSKHCFQLYTAYIFGCGSKSKASQVPFLGDANNHRSPLRVVKARYNPTERSGSHGGLAPSKRPSGAHQQDPCGAKDAGLGGAAPGVLQVGWPWQIFFFVLLKEEGVSRGVFFFFST